MNRVDADGMTKSRGVSRRMFLGSVGMSSAGAVLAVNAAHGAQSNPETPAATALPAGKALRVQPVLIYHHAQPQERTSWRSYGAIQSPEQAAAEAKVIDAELAALAGRSDFPITFGPVITANNAEQVDRAASGGADALLVYGAGGDWTWPVRLAASGTPNIMFVRHRSGAYYLWHEIAHWRFLRHNEDAMAEPNMDTGDVVVDDYDEVLWRLRALYGLANARGTKMLAIGSLAAYSAPAQELGPAHARDVWGYEIEIIPREDFAQRLARARGNTGVMAEVERQVADFLARPNVALATERRFVVNSFVALHVCRELLQEKHAFNFGFDHCMGGDVIGMLDTPPCLVLALANDEGYTAYCHTDLSHTIPGVLLRWISGKPTFVCNTHYPHEGLFTVAHCAAPMRMNGRDHEPTTVMTHYESDYGAATKVTYTKGQVVTVVVPNLHCTQWHGFRGRVIDSPSLPACRSQIDIEVDGDWRALLDGMEGFHAQVVYGDYLREVGYALKKVKQVAWRNYSEQV